MEKDNDLKNSGNIWANSKPPTCEFIDLETHNKSLLAGITLVSVMKRHANNLASAHYFYFFISFYFTLNFYYESKLKLLMLCGLQKCKTSRHVVNMKMISVLLITRIYFHNSKRHVGNSQSNLKRMDSSTAFVFPGESKC